MSSTSSLFDFEDFYSYHPLRNYQEPWYGYDNTIGHPLIYYTAVQPPSQRSRSGAKKSPNFFVKAFRWYTQEHQPLIKNGERAVNNPEFSGFADWLDAKYEQFIQEGQTEQRNQRTVSEPRKPKKIFATMKSHFTRRQKMLKDNARQKRSCNSCEFIMKPKNLSLTGSECRRCSVKAVCSDTQDKNSAMKSVSINSRYDKLYQKSIEIKMTEGDTNNKPEDDYSCGTTEVLTIFDNKPKHLNDVGIGSLPCDRSKDVVCECEKPAKIDAYSQYDKNMSASNTPARPTPSTPVPVKQTKVEQDKNKSPFASLSKRSPVHRRSPNPCDLTRQRTKSPKDLHECMCTASFEDDVKDFHQKDKNKSPFASLSKRSSIFRQRTKSPKVLHECMCMASFEDDVKASHQKNVATETEAVCSCAMTSPQPTKPVMHPAPVTEMPTPEVPAVPPPSRPTPIATSTKKKCPCRISETVQTSNTSILLDDEVIKYPFFMKIVRADKLIADC